MLYTLNNFRERFFEVHLKFCSSLEKYTFYNILEKMKVFKQITLRKRAGGRHN